MAKGLISNLVKFVKKNRNAILFSLLVLLIACNNMGKGLIEGMSANVPGADSDKKTFLYISMEGCGFCKKLNPIWDRFTKSHNSESSGIKPIKIEGTKTKEGKELSEKLNVNSYPAVMLLDKNGNKIDEYEGERTVEGLESYCEKNS